MGLARDTIVFTATNPGASGAVATPNTGDSFTVRNFAPADFALLEQITRQGATEGFVQATSPMLHDDVRGIRFTTAETPSVLTMPKAYGQPLRANDTLAVTISGGTAEVDMGALHVYYSNLIGSSARLHMWGDIAGNIANIKLLEVDFNTSATAGAWVDTLVTTTENLLKANTDYAVLGYLVDVATCVFGVKGQETGNLRVCGPGTTATDDTSNWFADRSEETSRPHIPVFNAANQGSVYVSCASAATSAAVKGQLVLAQLATNLSS